MVDTGDHANGHPRTNGAYISCLDFSRVLLEMPHRLNGTYSSKGEASQHEEQEEAEQAQFGAFTQHIQLLLVTMPSVSMGTKFFYLLACHEPIIPRQLFSAYEYTLLMAFAR